MVARPVPANLSLTTKAPSPINLEVLKVWLREYPDPKVAKFLIEGFTFGFRVRCSLRDVSTQGPNLLSVRTHLVETRAKLQKEWELGRIGGPVPQGFYPFLHINPLGLVPKSTPGEWRLITHLSYPKGLSVNDGISEEDKTVTYAKFDDSVNMIAKLGLGAEISKVDLKDCYRMFPMNVEDFHLLAFKFDGEVWVDKAMCMGLAQACQDCEVFTSFLEWCVRRHYRPEDPESVPYSHFLDDALMGGRAGTQECGVLLKTFMGTCDKLGVPLAHHKTVHPTIRLTFRGLELQTAPTMLVKVPKDKLETTLSVIRSLLPRKKVLVREIESLAGKLAFLCRAVWPGRTFVRRLYDLVAGTPNRNHHVRLTLEVKKDLQMWAQFLHNYNGVSMLQRPIDERDCDCQMWSDASGDIGWGAVFKQSWIQGRWPESYKGPHVSMALKEIIPVALAIVTFSHRMKGQRVLLWCDNISVVGILAKRTSPCPQIMHYIRLIVLTCMEWEISFSVKFLRSAQNEICDSLSRYQMFRFRQVAADMEQFPTPVAGHLMPS